MASKRIFYIDIARAISIVLIVIYHYQPENSPDWYLLFNDVIRSFRLPLLLFVSGYIYWATRKPVTYKSFAWKKFQRLMIPYFFVSIFVISLKLLSQGNLQVDDPVTLSAFYQMFYLPIVSGFFLWFIYVLFLIFLIMPFFNSRNKLLILLGISLILYFIPVSFPNLFALFNLKLILCFFVLGCVVCEFVEIREKIPRINVFLILCFFAIIYVFRERFDLGAFVPVITFVLALCGIYIVAQFAQFLDVKTKKIRASLLKISTYTYAIYLFHTTFEGFTKAVVLKLLPQNTGSTFIISAFIVILAGVAGPIILHTIVVRYSRLFSYLIGANFAGRKAKSEK